MFSYVKISSFHTLRYLDFEDLIAFNKERYPDVLNRDYLYGREPFSPANWACLWASPQNLRSVNWYLAIVNCVLIDLSLHSLLFFFAFFRLLVQRYSYINTMTKIFASPDTNSQQQLFSTQALSQTHVSKPQMALWSPRRVSESDL